MIPKINRRLNRLIIIFLLFFATQQICGAAENNRKSPVVNAVLRVSPAVVNISSEYEVRTRANPFSGFGMDSFFDSFFKDFFEPGFERQYKRTNTWIRCYYRWKTGTHPSPMNMLLLRPEP